MSARPAPRPVRVVVFAGGRGATSIIAALARQDLDVTVLVNAYDDGLSTGRVRRFVPGMLGPSDVRKNLGRLLDPGHGPSGALAALLDFRLPDGTDGDTGRAVLAWMAGRGDPPLPELVPLHDGLTVAQAREVGAWAARFLDHDRASDPGFDYGDCAIGNLVFSGAFLAHDRDFNRTIDAYAALAPTRARVLNVTDGQALVLVGLRDDGSYLADEAAIVSAAADAAPIREVFLLPGYLDDAERAALEAAADRVAWLRAREVVPEPNPAALAALAAADLVVYGPGTQHSSLLPSYLTRGVLEAIRDNAGAARCLVTNIHHDHDIPRAGVEDLVDAFRHYLTRKGAAPADLSALLTHCLVQDVDADDLNRRGTGSYVQFTREGLEQRLAQARFGDWEAESGRHAGGAIADALLNAIPDAGSLGIAPLRHRVSVVLPTLDEVATIGQVLDELSALELDMPGVALELLVVDRGSVDGTVDVVRGRDGVRLYRLEGGGGRGAAMRLGAAKARGDIVAFFAGDGEYQVSDLPSVLRPIFQNRFRVVYGSRAIKLLSLDERLRRIYGSNNFRFLISKYGGMALSIACLLRYNRYIADPLTAVKAFDRRLFETLGLRRDDVGFEGELLARLAARREFVLEVPVDHDPKSQTHRIRISVGEGLRALWAVIAGG